MTHTAPDDGLSDFFDNALAVFTHDIRVLLSEDACQELADRVREVHADRPDLDFAATIAAARASLAENGMAAART